MTRKRRSNQCSAERAAEREERLNQYVILFRFEQEMPIGDDPAAWQYRSVSDRIAREMVKTGEAEELTVYSRHNGWLMCYRESQVFAQLEVSPTSLSAKTTIAVGNDQPGAKLSGAERRQIENFRVHAFCHDTKAPLVGNRVDDAYRRNAQKLLFGRPAQKEHSRRDGAVRTWRAEEHTAA